MPARPLPVARVGPRERGVRHLGQRELALAGFADRVSFEAHELGLPRQPGGVDALLREPVDPARQGAAQGEIRREVLHHVVERFAEARRSPEGRGLGDASAELLPPPPPAGGARA